MILDLTSLIIGLLFGFGATSLFFIWATRDWIDPSVKKWFDENHPNGF